MDWIIFDQLLWYRFRVKTIVIKTVFLCCFIDYKSVLWCMTIFGQTLQSIIIKTVFLADPGTLVRICTGQSFSTSLQNFMLILQLVLMSADLCKFTILCSNKKKINHFPPKSIIQYQLNLGNLGFNIIAARSYSREFLPLMSSNIYLKHKK